MESIVCLCVEDYFLLYWFNLETCLIVWACCWLFIRRPPHVLDVFAIALMEPAWPYQS